MNTERHVYWCYSSVVPSLLLVRIRRPCDRLICWGGTSIGPENVSVKACLTTLRLIERGVRFAQVFHGSWKREQQRRTPTQTCVVTSAP